MLHGDEINGTGVVRALIRENKTYRIASEIQTGSQYGMISLDAHLASLVNRGMVEADVALEKSQNPNELKQKFRDAGIAFTEV